MSVDLTPEVRIRAARAVESILDEGWQPEFDKDFELRMEREIVDAVVAVVAPEIERPLQARIEELEATLADNRKLWDESIAQTGAALEQSRRIYAEFVTGQHEEALTRVELLTAALTEIANRACEGPDVEDCGDEHVDRDAWCDRCKARAALAAGETESEA